MATAKIVSRITKMEKELSALKSSLNNVEDKLTKVKKPKKIDDCESIEELKKFSVTELKEWLKKNKINVKKVSEKHKDDFVKIVWQEISNEYESDYSEDESEVNDSGDESDEWEYYYE